MKEKSSLIFFKGKYQLVLKYFPIDEIKMCFPTEFKGTSQIVDIIKNHTT